MTDCVRQVVQTRQFFACQLNLHLAIKVVRGKEEENLPELTSSLLLHTQATSYVPIIFFFPHELQFPFSFLLPLFPLLNIVYPIQFRSYPSPFH